MPNQWDDCKLISKNKETPIYSKPNKKTASELIVLKGGCAKVLKETEKFVEVLITCNVVDRKTSNHAQIGDHGYVFKEDLKQWKVQKQEC